MNLSALLHDFRHALRSLSKSPGTTILAVLMMALGIGATTAIFSVFYGVLLKPLPFPEPERIVQLWQTKLSLGWTAGTFTEANFWDVRARNRSFEEIGVLRQLGFNLTGGGEPMQVIAGEVSAGFFQVLRANPVAGRIFLPGDDQPGNPSQIAMLSHDFWKRRFGGDPAIVGKTLLLDRRSYEVVGVLPAGEPWFNEADLFIPLVFNPKADRGSMEFVTIGRLKPGVTMATAQADLESIGKQLAAEFPKDNDGLGFAIDPSSRWVGGDDLRLALRVLIGAVGLLLLIACVNLTNLLLARATGRSREMVIRQALGATRGRLAWLAIAESLLLCCFGSSLGLFLAWGGVATLKAADPGGIPRLAEIEINWLVLAFTLATAVVVAVISALAPALRSPHAQMMTALREGERSQAGGRVQKRLRAGLVTVEVALSLILLIGAGLLMRSFGELLRVDPGFQTQGRLVFTVSASDYKPPQLKDLVERFAERAKANPQVISASAITWRPIVGSDPGMGIASKDKPEAFAGNIPWAGWRLASPGYFRTIGVPLIAGRDFLPSDEIAKPWRVIISQRLAEMLWPGENPVGRHALLWKGQGDNDAEVIGVVGNMHERGLQRDFTLTVYIPYFGSRNSSVQMVVHTAGDPMKQFPMLRSIVSQMDASLPVTNIQTFDQIISRSVARQRFNMTLLSVFAGIALVLAMIGIYGVLAYSVARRTAEIGLRAALGATPGKIFALVLRQGMTPIGVGIIIGVGGAFWLSRFLASLLFAIKPADPATYAGVVALVLLTAFVSCSVPARRALRVDPVTALREE